MQIPYPINAWCLLKRDTYSWKMDVRLSIYDFLVDTRQALKVYALNHKYHIFIFPFLDMYFAWSIVELFTK